MLFGADAYAPVLAESLRRLLKQRGETRLALAAFKLAHHGSQNNTSVELLELLDCSRYLVSSNGAHFCHPDRQAVARIVKHGGEHPSVSFNYRTRYNEIWGSAEMQQKYGYAAQFPEGEGQGMAVSLLAPKVT